MLRNIKVGLKKISYGVFYKNYLLYFAVQILSKMKYQIALANGSTIASVRAIIKDTSAINIKTVMAIAK